MKARERPASGEPACQHLRFRHAASLLLPPLHSNLLSSPSFPPWSRTSPPPGLTAGDNYIKFDLLRDDGTKAATARAVVHVLGGGGQHGSEL